MPFQVCQCFQFRELRCCRGVCNQFGAPTSTALSLSLSRDQLNPPRKAVIRKFPMSVSADTVAVVVLLLGFYQILPSNEAYVDLGVIQTLPYAVLGYTLGYKGHGSNASIRARAPRILLPSAIAAKSAIQTVACKFMHTH